MSRCHRNHRNAHPSGRIHHHASSVWPRSDDECGWPLEPVERRAARPCWLLRGRGDSGQGVSLARRRRTHGHLHPAPQALPLTRAPCTYRVICHLALDDITAGPTLMLDLACASPVAACRREPLREPPWVRWTGHAALEAPACLPLRWAAGAADLRHGWPKQAGRAAAG